MDIAPWHRGHALVIPRRHVRDVGEASPDDVAHVLRAAQRLAGRMRERLGHGDVTLANAMGEAAGQTVFHFHVHVVPGLEVDVPRRAPEPGELEEIAAKLR
jgi:histidine triad (HIT) family protein